MNEDKDESKDEDNEQESALYTFCSHVGEGIGCLFICVGIAVVIWALFKFPALWW